MRRFLAGLWLISACAPRELPPVDAGPMPMLAPVHAHAHNDYAHTRPLLDALDQKFDSVEADVWADGPSELGVSHDGPPFKGSLKALYLDPLKARVDAMGSVHGDGKPFFLWLDFKDSSAAVQDTLVAQLATCESMLTRFEDANEVPGAVTIVLTGGNAKKALADKAAPRFWIRDSNDFSADDPMADTRWGYYAVSYWSFLSWPGDGTAMPAAQKRQLQNLIDGAHAKGRRLRIYASPDTPAYWKAARALGLDFLNADDLTGLRSALDP